MSTEMSLKDAVADLSEAFAIMLLEAVGKASLGELADLANGAPAVRRGRPPGPSSSKAPKKRGSKRVRRSAADLDVAVTKIVTLVKKHKGGVSAETIREELGIERKELPRPIKHALSQRLISKRGQKRATLYFAGGKTSSGGGKKAKPAKAKKKTSSSKKGKRSVSARVGANGVTAAAAPAAE